LGYFMTKLPTISLVLTFALTLFMLFGPSYMGGGYGESKPISGIEANGARALLFLIPVCVAALGLVPALGKFPGLLMFLYGFVSGGWLYIIVAFLMLIPSDWKMATRTTRITSAVGISVIVGVFIFSLVNWKLNLLPVGTTGKTLQETIPPLR